jgi:p21-activated kinase 1
VKGVRKSKRLASGGVDSTNFKGFGVKDNNMILKKRPAKTKRTEEGECNEKKKQHVEQERSRMNTDTKHDNKDIKLVARSLFKTYHDPTDGYVELVYDIGHKLGSGRFGNVYYAKARETSNAVAIKTRDIKDVESLKAELDLMKPICNEHVTKYIHHSFAFDRNYLYLTMEYIDGMSVNQLVRKVRLDMSTIATITKGILLGLEHLHGHGIMHRDVKGDNVLVSKVGGQVKLTDFGCAIKVGSAALSRQVGTPRYMAPELIFSTSYDSKVDVWAAGMTLLEMINRKRPYAEVPGDEGPALVETIFKHVLDQIMPRLDNEETVPEDAKAFMTSCAEFMGDERPTATELLKHRFIKSALTRFKFGKTLKGIFVQKVFLVN